MLDEVLKKGNPFTSCLINRTEIISVQKNPITVKPVMDHS